MLPIPSSHPSARVYVHGETFEIYHYGDCGFSGTDTTSIRIHIATSHKEIRNVCDSPDEFGIAKLPVVAKKEKAES